MVTDRTHYSLEELFALGINDTPAVRRTLARFGGQLPRLAGADGEEDGERPPADAGDGDGNDLGDAGKRAIDEERKARRDAEKARKAADKAREEAEARVQQFEDADKSEKDKLEERLTKAEAAATAAVRKSLQYEVAAEKGMKLTAANRLDGTTKEEMEADADRLIADFGDGVLLTSSSQEKKPDEQAPKPQGKGGDGGATTPAGEAQQMTDYMRQHFPGKGVTGRQAANTT